MNRRNLLLTAVASLFAPLRKWLRLEATVEPIDRGYALVVGGEGNLNDCSHWATSSGGPAPPGFFEDVLCWDGEKHVPFYTRPWKIGPNVFSGKPHA